MIIFIDKENCIKLHKQLIDPNDKYPSYMLMQTIVGNVNHIHFNFDDSEKIDEAQDEDLRRFTLWGNVEGVGNIKFSYKNSRIDNENKFTGIHPPLSSSNRFDKNFHFNDLYQEYLSSAFMLNVNDDNIKEYKRKVMICGIGQEMELMESIYKLATSGNFNLIEKPVTRLNNTTNRRITDENLIILIAENYKKLFPDDIPFTYIIVDDPYFMSETKNNDNLFIKSFFYAINSIVKKWKKEKLVDSDHKVQILICHHKAKEGDDTEKNKIEQTKKDITDLLTSNEEYMNNITAKNSDNDGHDRWIYTNYYALASGRGFVSAGGTTYMRFPRMGSNADVINNLIGNRTPDTTDKENEVNTVDVNEFYKIISDFLKTEHCKKIRGILDGISMGPSFSKNVKRYFERVSPKYKQPIQENDVRWDLADYVREHEKYFNQFRENLNSHAKVFEYLHGKGTINDQAYNTIIKQLLIPTQSCLAVFAFRIIPFLEDIREKLGKKLEIAKTEKTR